MLVTIRLHGGPLDGQEREELQIRCERLTTFRYWIEAPDGTERLVKYGAQQANGRGSFKGWEWHEVE